jgi:hypothetical protein
VHAEELATKTIEVDFQGEAAAAGKGGSGGGT